MSLENRLEILKSAGMLTDENHSIVKNVMNMLENDHNLTLTEENAAAFITHLAQALGRVSAGEPVMEVDEIVYASVTESPYFGQADEIGAKVMRLVPTFPEEELKFLRIHLCVLLDNIN